MKLTGRDKKEAEDLDKLIELRKNYLDKKGKKPTPKNIKVDMRSTREKKEAAEYKKLEVLRKRYLTNVKKSKIPKVKKINSVKEIDTVIKEIKSGDYIAKGKRTGSEKPSISIAVVTVKPGESRDNIKKRVTGKKLESRGKRTGNKKPTPYVAKSKRTSNKKPLAPIKSVKPKINPTSQKGYYEDKKKGNAMVRVFPNDFVNGWANMTNAERKAKGYPTSDSKKYKVDYNQRKELTFIIKN